MLSVVKTQDKVLDITSPVLFSANTSAKTINYQQISANSYGPSSNNQFLVIPGNSEYVVDRRMIVKWDFAVNITGITAGAINFTDGTFGLRSYPIDAAASSVKVSVNNQSIDQTYPNEIRRLKQISEDVQLLNTCASQLQMPDQSQQYSDLVGSNRNPLASYSDNVAGEGVWTTRGSWNQNFTITGNTGGTCQFTFSVYEPIWLSPMVAEGDAAGFCYVNQMRLEYKFADLSRMFSSSLGGLTITVTMPTPPTLYTVFYTLQPDQVLPEKQMLNYEDFTPQVSNDTTIASGASQTLVLNNITINQIPKFLCIYVKQRDSDETYRTTDTEAFISNVKISFNNNNTLLSDMSSWQLWQLSRKNGVKRSWVEWRYQRGSLIVIDASDLNLDQDQAPGVAGISTNLSVQVVAQNISNASKVMNLYLLPVVEGVMVLHRTLQVELNQSPITADQVRSAPYAGANVAPKYGGSIFGLLSKAIPFLRQTGLVSSLGNVLSKSGIPIVSDIAGVATPIAKSLGFGRRGKVKYGGALVDSQYFQDM